MAMAPMKKRVASASEQQQEVMEISSEVEKKTGDIPLFK
jgi:hypothetical protein